MATKKEDEKKDLQPAQTAALETSDRPDWLEDGDQTGTEGMTMQDLRLPRLTLAQLTSKQLIEQDAKYIPGLKLGMVFNDLTSQLYGPGPFEIVVIRRDPPRGIEFFPMEQGGGIKDMDVKVSDPRMQFGPNGEKPAATKFYDYVVWLLAHKQMIALSMKGKSLSAAREFNTLIKGRQAPVYAGRYTLGVVVETNKKGTYAKWSVRDSSVVDEYTLVKGDKPRPMWVSKEVFDACAKLHEGIKDKKLDINREPGDDDEEFPGAGAQV